MIDLKRNSKKIPVPASGLRVRKKFIYKPNQLEDFKISRGKFWDFLTCPKCFYLDRVSGLDVPKTPQWTLNETTDLLLKKEFDYLRVLQKPHRLFIENKLDHLVPFQHEEMDAWRDALHRGLKIRYKDTNIILTGGVDDIWQDKITKKLIIVEYKSQAKNGLITTKEYLEDPYHKGYKVQIDFYSYLLTSMGFDVHPTSYFLVCNAIRTTNNFNKVMKFDEYLIPYDWNNDWVEEEIDNMIKTMNYDKIPEANPCCRNCAYSEQYAKLKSTKSVQNGDS